MTDADFWFNQFRNMVNHVSDLRNRIKNLEDDLDEERKKNTDPRIGYDKIHIIKKVRDLCRDKSTVEYDQDDEEKIIPPTLIEIKNLVEQIMEKNVRII